jgi:hypothetical protein
MEGDDNNNSFRSLFGRFKALIARHENLRVPDDIDEVNKADVLLIDLRDELNRTQFSIHHLHL